jgi:hypothetical protein
MKTTKPAKPQYYSSVPKAFRKIELKYDFTNRKGREWITWEGERKTKNGKESNGTERKTYNATNELQT